MKDILTVIALLLSLSGILASLMREEVRCYLGLPSQVCKTTEKPTVTPTSPKEVGKPVMIPPKIEEIAPQPPTLPETTILIPETPDPNDPPSQEINSPPTALDSPLPESSPEGIPIPVEPYQPTDP